jgi:SAM-dependent methyltransferase
LNYLARAVPRTSGPILEVGSKNHGAAAQFRSLYPGVPYVGVNIQAHENVDLVLDLTIPPPNDLLRSESFSLIICSSVLEHVDKPWLMAEQLSRLLKPGGSVFVGKLDWAF